MFPLPSPSPFSPSLPVPFPSLSFPSPPYSLFPFPSPLPSPTFIAARRSGERLSSPSGSGRSLAAIPLNAFLVHFMLKSAHSVNSKSHQHFLLLLLHFFTYFSQKQLRCDYALFLSPCNDRFSTSTFILVCNLYADVWIVD